VNKRGDVLAVLLLVGVWALVVALVGLGGDFALNDDWVYASTARHLLRTGELRIHVWSTASLGAHALWGAGALRLLGDSYVALRCGTLAWALCGALCLYGLARSADLAPRIAVVAPLCLMLSPWFVNLAFTYMTDVPWLAMMLAALLAFVRALHTGSSAPPRPALLLLSGTLVGAAATTRQYAIITTPAFALVLWLDARQRHGARWRWPAARSGAFFGLPAVALFGMFYLWYNYVHGATQAYRETARQILSLRPWHPIVFAWSTLHYAGLWLFPLALALLAQRRLGEVVNRRQAVWALALLGSYAVGRPILTRPLLGGFLDPRGPGGIFDHPADMVHPLMPYLGNIFYLIGLGPPTLTGLYRDQQASSLHPGVWLGVLLTVASTLGGIAGAGLLVMTARRVRQAVRMGGGPPSSRREMLRVLLVSFGAIYLLFQLSTSTGIFDRYLLPLLPVVVLLGLDAAPRDLARSPAVVAVLVVSGLFSVAGTREYLSWAGARDRAVRALVARGIPAADIDGGYEVNGPLHFESYRRRTGELLGNNDFFWLENAPYRISFWPSRSPGCITQEHYPYWTWPGGGERAVYVLQCNPPSSLIGYDTLRAFHRTENP
jgi:4-amino-4-deoxy-L-arabinose transferase-like glycosyltransferase